MKRTWCLIFLFGCTSMCQSFYYKEKIEAFGTAALTSATLVGVGLCSYGATHALAKRALPQDRAKNIAFLAAALSTTGTIWGFGPYLWQISSMICSKERKSQHIAKSLLQEVELYLQYLRVIKTVHAKLDELVSLLDQKEEGANDSPLITRFPVYHVATYCQDMRHKSCEILERICTISRMYNLPSVARECMCLFGNRSLENNAPNCSQLAPHVKSSYLTVMSILRAMDTNELDRVSAERLREAIDGLLSYWDMFVEGLYKEIQAKIVYCQRLCVIEEFVSMYLGYELGQAPIQSS